MIETGVLTCMYKFILEHGTIKGTSYLTICVYLNFTAESSLIHVFCVLHDMKAPNVCDTKSFSDNS